MLSSLVLPSYTMCTQLCEALETYAGSLAQVDSRHSSIANSLAIVAVNLVRNNSMVRGLAHEKLDVRRQIIWSVDASGLIPMEVIATAMSSR